MIRTTQRAPRSCVPCTKRKIKCDKGVPCRPCLARSAAQDCRRETVMVRGQLRTGELGQSGATFEDIMQDNARLRAMLSGQPAPLADGLACGSSHTNDCRPEVAEHYLLEKISRSSRTRSVWTIQDVVVPSREFSDLIVHHAYQWTFWVHYALFIPDFEKQHSEFRDRLSETGSLDGVDTFWLATYFSVLAASLLFMDEEETADCRPPHMTFMDLLRNWYESALLFLDRGDFMQNIDINTIRAIAILNIVFNNVGDVHRHMTLWSVAIRQAQQLKLGVDSAHPGETYTEQQLRRRLWWTLVLCEWLSIPYRSPCINDMDFDCRLPDEIDDHELATCTAPSRLARSKPRPITYHITMIKVSKIYYQIRYKLRLRNWHTAEVAALVFSADEQLANLITELPPYLQFDELLTEASRKRDLQNPFIPWQKESLSLVLLYHRMAIGRLLQEHWLDGSITGARTRAICLSSARGLINCTLQMKDASKLRLWAVARNVFSACATLALESSTTGEDFAAEIHQGLDFLRRIRPHNIVSEYGIEILEDLLKDGHSIALKSP